MNKKLYIISYFFAPLGRADGVNRTYMVKFLSEQDWNIEVFSCGNPHGFLQSFQKDETLLKLIPASVKLHRPKSFYWGPIGAFLDIAGILKDPFANWLLPAYKKALNEINDKGIVYAIVPPTTNAQIAYKLAQKKGLPLVIDFRDNVYNLPKHIVQACDTIIASSDQSLDEMRAYYNLPHNKGITIYNGYQKESSLFPQNHNSNTLKFIYAGVLSRIQNPAIIVKALKLMEEKYPDSKGRVTFEFYGPHNYYTSLFLKKHLNQKITFHGYIPYKEILKKISEADYGFVSLTPKGYEYAIPSKVFQYISMEVPIFGIGPLGALKDFIENNNIGMFSFAKDIDQMADKIYHLLEQPGKRVKMINNIRKLKPSLKMTNQVSLLSDHLIEFL